MIGDFIPFIHNFMDYSDVNSKTIANNIANSNTPGYKTKATNFTALLNSELKTTLNTENEKHISKTKDYLDMDFETRVESGNNARFDGNNVNQTEEMIKMLKNNYANSLSVSAMNSELNLFKSAIGR